MSSWQRQDSSHEVRRPPVAGAPEWFNRARAAANQRQVFRPRPAPITRISPGPDAAVNRSSPRRDGRWIFGLALVAVPLVFSAGYCARGTRENPDRPPASGRLEAGVAEARPENHRAEVEASEPADVPVGPTAARGASEPDERGLAEQNVPAPIAASSPIDHRRSPTVEIAAAAIETPPASPARAIETPDGFSLRSPGLVRQISAEIVQPVNAWFDATAKEGDCTTGTCPAPVRTVVDRKLNTALEWSPGPEAAAASAEREGKLVFLIHVSGNFAQPGFT
jgi:hypothetical protein